MVSPSRCSLRSSRALQRAGLITYHRGRVKVLHRKGLEAASCECYRTTTNLLQGVTSIRLHSALVVPDALTSGNQVAAGETN